MICWSAVRISLMVSLLLSIFFVLSHPYSMAETGKEPDEKEILVIGTASVEDGNVAEAKKRALSEALVKGVEAYLTRRLGKDGMINNFSRLVQEIIPKAKEQIEIFNILTEERIGGQYKILVRLKVNEKMMEDQLRAVGVTLMQGPPVKVLFLVSQIKPREGEIQYWWKDPETQTALTPIELVLYRVFQERGFGAINRMASVPEGNYSSEMEDLYLSDEEAVKWGRLYSADVVIHGRCEIIEGKEVSVILKAFDTEKNFIIAQDSETESIEEASGSIDKIMEIIDDAVSKIAKRLGPTILRTVEEPGAKVSQLDVTLEGLTHFSQVKAFRDFLMRDLGGVKSVIETRAKGSSISFMVEYMGDSEKFLLRAAGHEKIPFKEFR